VIFSPAGTCDVAEERMTSNDELECKDWFFCTKKLDKDTVFDEILKK
jgi:peroxiredoxin (alkyl hydroperoxide reductase subunit C)